MFLILSTEYNIVITRIKTQKNEWNQERVTVNVRTNMHEKLPYFLYVNMYMLTKRQQHYMKYNQTKLGRYRTNRTKHCTRRFSITETGLVP